MLDAVADARQVHAAGCAERDCVRRSRRLAGRAAVERQSRSASTAKWSTCSRRAVTTRRAQQLEQLWNDLGRRESYTLFCGYASGHFGDPKTAKLLADICASHSHLHRKGDDLLAEYLLEQPDVKSARRAATSRS